jgi:hypothetical protein
MTMATTETKKWALATALNIITKAAEGGYNKQSLFVELDDLYKKLIVLSADSNKND